MSSVSCLAGRTRGFESLVRGKVMFRIRNSIDDVHAHIIPSKSNQIDALFFEGGFQTVRRIWRPPGAAGGEDPDTLASAALRGPTAGRPPYHVDQSRSIARPKNTPLVSALYPQLSCVRASTPADERRSLQPVNSRLLLRLRRPHANAHLKVPHLSLRFHPPCEAIRTERGRSIRGVTAFSHHTAGHVQRPTGDIAPSAGPLQAA